MTVPDSTPIADRVRFWEEQDKINQELIPRVIRQHELLTAHIADHDNLPLVAGNAISEALAEAREEQQRHYDAALEVAKQEQQQQYDASLETAKQEQQEQYNNAALEAASGRNSGRSKSPSIRRRPSTAINDEAHGQHLEPSTLGTFLRSFRWGHVRQLDRVRRWQAGAGPGDGPLTIDLDSTTLWATRWSRRKTGRASL